MERKGEEETWQNIRELLSRSGGELNILEEEIDVLVQRQYMALMERILKEGVDVATLQQQAREDVNLLFDDSVSREDKKRLLVLLATIDDVAIYRAIESFSKKRGALKKWAVIALQQSRMLIRSTLMDESAVYVSTGLGGHGSQLRYFCVFLANDGIILQPFQHRIIQQESELVITRTNGSIEQVNFYEKYVTLLLLLPIEVNLKEMFENIVEECNTYGNFLRENMIVTNVRKLSTKEIEHFLERYSDEE